jgi:hypothetical protein
LRTARSRSSAPDLQGKRLVCNPTRSKILLKAFGINGQNWVGKLIVLSRGITLYQGEKVPCIDVEAIATTKIAAPPERKTIEASPPPPSEVDPPPCEDDIGDLDPDDEIPF